MSNRQLNCLLVCIVVMLPALGCNQSGTAEGEATARLQKEVAQLRAELSNVTAELKKLQAVPVESGRLQSSSRKAEELKWAKEVGDYFLQCIVSRRLSDAEANLTESRKAQGHRSGYDTVAVVFYGPGGANPGVGYGELESWKIEEEAISPDHDEALFKGLLIGPTRKDSFSIRVLKEKTGGGKWRVDSFMIQRGSK